MNLQLFNLTYFSQWSIPIIFIFNLICNAYSKSFYTSEVFGDLNQTASSKTNSIGYDKNGFKVSNFEQPTVLQGTLNSEDSQPGSNKPNMFMQPFPTQTSRVPLYLYNPNLARQIGLSTLMVGGVLYSLTIIPALLAASGLGSFSDLFNFFGKQKRRKRSIFTGYVHEMPLMNKESTNKFLSLFETTLDVRRVDSAVCKKHYICKVYQTALMSGEEPLTLSSFEKAIINTFGIAAERKDYHLKLIPTVKKYFEPAIVGITGSNCTKIYPCLWESRFNHLSHFWKSTLIK